MDEYDEEIYAIAEGRRSERRPDDYEHFPIRLFEQEEEFYIITKGFYHRNGTDELYSPYRVLRFFRTVAGFHTGDLDLTGRFESRYTDLMSRWNVFSSQLNEIRRQDTRRRLTVAEDEAKTLVEPSDGGPDQAMDPELLESFCSRWRLQPETIVNDLVSFYKEHDDVIAWLKHNPEPKFQRLLLLDLPVELLHHVMGYLDAKGCRILRVCCPTLREASVLYAYEDMTFELAVEMPQIFGDGMCQTDDEGTHEERREDAVGRFVERIDAICEVPTACQRMRRLRFCNSLDNEDRFPGTHVQLSPWLVPVTRAVNTLLSCARDITSLVITHIPIQRCAIESILALPNLHTLELQCKIEIDEPITLHNSSVLNATFTIVETHDTAWRVLLCLPSLRCLTVLNENAVWWLPSDEERSRANVFTTLERVVLHDLHALDVDELAGWIRQAPPPNGSGLRLTQLKIKQRSRLLDGEEIRTIVSALHGAPMRDLVLDGVAYAAPDMLDLIADAFPDLRSLTLCYRDRPRGYGRADACWPRPTWEYAPRLANFRGLQHFRWNWRLSGDGFSPSAMLHFEDGFPERWEEVAESQCASDAFADEWESIPRLFRAHCATLESFAFLGADQTLPYCCWDVTEDGLRLYSTELAPDSPLLTEFDPECEEGWPRFWPPPST